MLWANVFAFPPFPAAKAKAKDELQELADWAN
jgi:hypothetical protein